MSTVSRYQGGAKAETTYGTPVTVNRFWPMISDTIAPQFARMESNALRPGFMQHSDTFATYELGAQGALKFEWTRKAMGFWLAQMFGNVSTTNTGATYTHTSVMADLVGTSFTWQGNRPTFPTDGDQAFTFAGCKVTKWKLENQESGLLLLTLDVDAQTHATATGLASASYASSNPPLSFVGGVLTVSGTQVDVTDVSFESNPNLKLDRRYIRGSALKKEPVENNFRDCAIAFTADFDSLTLLNYVKSATAAGTQAELSTTWTDGTYSLNVDVKACRFDEGYPTVGGPERLTQPIKAMARYDGTHDPVIMTYVTSDTTP